tara:strand:- start:15323 stop:16315 length:993 start_codon:yes stop_codon:yes gene_type:complete
MPKKVKKVKGVAVGSAVATPLTPLTYLEEYAKWVKTCKELSGETIGLRRSTNTMWEYLGDHVINPRPKSENDGSTGFYTSLPRFNRIITNTKIPREKEITELKAMKEALEELKTHPSLSPRNTMFKRPKKFSRTGKYSKKEGKDKIFGHYLDSFFAAKHGTTNREADGWVSTSKDTATPPAHQALYGEGKPKLFDMGLYDIILLGLEEIDGLKYHLVIDTAKPARYLIEIPSFRKVLGRAISTSKVGDAVSVSKINSKLINRKYPAPTDAKTHKLLAKYAGIKGVEADFISFEIVLTPARTKTLVQYYMRSNMSVKTRTLAKAWMDILVV